MPGTKNKMMDRRMDMMRGGGMTMKRGGMAKKKTVKKKTKKKAKKKIANLEPSLFRGGFISTTSLNLHLILLLLN